MLGELRQYQGPMNPRAIFKKICQLRVFDRNALKIRLDIVFSRYTENPVFTRKIGFYGSESLR